MTITNDVNDFLNSAGGPPAFKFTNVGDTAKGTVVTATVQQARDFKTGQPKTYDDGNPIKELVVTLRREDGEECRVFCKPAAKAAIRDAVVAAGAQGLEPGGQLAVQYSGDEAAQTVGLNPKKLFKAQYQPPANTVSTDDLL